MNFLLVHLKSLLVVSVIVFAMILGSLAYGQAKKSPTKSTKSVSSYNNNKESKAKKKKLASAEASAKIPGVHKKKVAGVADCRSCTSSSSCPVGYRCRVAELKDGITERVCSKPCQSNSDCPSGYRCGSSSRPQFNGGCWPIKSLGSYYSSCKGSNNQGKKCEKKSECDYDSQGAACSTIENGVCRVLCDMDNPRSCTAGYQCGCPAGYEYNLKKYSSWRTPCIKNHGTVKVTYARCIEKH